MKSFKINCILMSTIFFWASAFIGIKIGLMGYTPGSLGLLRFLTATLCMGILYYNQKITQTIPWKDRILLILSGIAGIGIYNICLNYGEITVSAGIASFVIGLMPVITILLSLVFLKEKLNVHIWIGILVSLLGLSLLALWEVHQEHMALGISLILVSAFTGGVLTLVQRQYAKHYHPVAITAWVIWGGTLSLLIFLPQLAKEIQTAPHEATCAAIYMGIFPGALAYYAWGYVLKTITASKASISLYALPIVSTLLGFAVLHEHPSSISLLGGGIALGGAFIANFYQKPKSLTNTKIEDSVVTT